MYWPRGLISILVLPPNYIYKKTLSSDPATAKTLTYVYRSTSQEYKRIKAAKKREYIQGGRKGLKPHTDQRFIDDAARKIRAFSVFPYLVTMEDDKDYHIRVPIAKMLALSTQQ